jgi:hypothetical protein
MVPGDGKRARQTALGNKIARQKHPTSFNNGPSWSFDISTRVPRPIIPVRHGVLDLRSQPGRKKKEEDTLGQHDDPPNEADDGLPSEEMAPLGHTRHDMGRTDVFSNVMAPCRAMPILWSAISISDRHDPKEEILAYSAWGGGGALWYSSPRLAFLLVFYLLVPVAALEGSARFRITVLLFRKMERGGGKHPLRLGLRHRKAERPIGSRTNERFTILQRLPTVQEAMPGYRGLCQDPGQKGGVGGFA